MLKILHFSDAHLRDRDIEEAGKCLEFLIDTAEREDVDLIVFAGDLFDSQEVKLDSKAAKTAIKSFSRLADIAPVFAVIGTPSHDGTAAEVLSFVRGLHTITVATAPQQQTVTCRGNVDVILTLIPQPTKQHFQTLSGIEGADKEIAQAMAAVFAGFGAQAEQEPYPHILVGHWNVSGARLPSGYVRTGLDIEISTDQMMLAKPDLCLLGHIHAPQQIGDRTFYAGPIYPVKVDEQKCGFWIHESRDMYGEDEWESQYIETPFTKTVRFRDDFTTADGWPTGDILDHVAPDEDITGKHVRIELNVWEDEAHLINKASLEKAVMGSAASCDIRIIRVPRANVRAESVLKADTLRDKLLERAALAGEEVDTQVLAMADVLEGTPADRLLQMVMSA